MTRWQKIRRRLRQAGLVLGVLLGCKLAWFWWMAPPAAGQDADEERADLAMRRAYLLERVASREFGVADMPSIVRSPYREELAIATLSMTSVALTNLSFRQPGDLDTNRDAVRLMIERALSGEIRQYDIIWWGEDAIDSLDGDNGHAGYLGHLNLMLGCYFLLGGDDAGLREMFTRVSATLARRVAASGSYHAESFPGWTYTADIVVVMLSLRVHDMTLEPRYAEILRQWLDFTRERLLDADNGMLRYHVSPDGQAAGTARGVLQAWNSMWPAGLRPEPHRHRLRDGRCGPLE